MLLDVIARRRESTVQGTGDCKVRKYQHNLFAEATRPCAGLDSRKRMKGAYAQNISHVCWTSRLQQLQTQNLAGCSGAITTTHT
eukprot:6198837-Pleurochrysis_carterae.AAC.4